MSQAGSLGNGGGSGGGATTFVTDSGTATPVAGVLNVNGGTNVNTSGAGNILLINATTPLTTKGDLFTFSTVNTRLPVGTDGQVLSADSTQATGLKWIASGGIGTVTNVSGTAGQITVVNPTTAPVISIDPTYVGQSSITTLGTITTGTWNGTTIDVPHGGTGNTTFTAYSVICAGTTATGVFQNVSGLGSSGNVLTSNGSGALPTWQAPAASGGLTWQAVTSASNPVTLVKNNGYIAKGASQVQFVLPASAAIGDTFAIMGIANLWTITQNANQNITIGTSTTTTGVGGSVTATSVSDCIQFICSTANLNFNKFGELQGNPTIV